MEYLELQDVPKDRQFLDKYFPLLDNKENYITMFAKFYTQNNCQLCGGYCAFNFRDGKTYLATFQRVHPLYGYSIHNINVYCYTCDH
ncbi:unnamed protein product [Cunninghamella blakesleeana]